MAGTEFTSTAVEKRENNHKKYFEFSEKQPSDWKRKKWKHQMRDECSTEVIYSVKAL